MPISSSLNWSPFVRNTLTLCSFFCACSYSVLTACCYPISDFELFCVVSNNESLNSSFDFGSYVTSSLSLPSSWNLPQTDDYLFFLRNMVFFCSISLSILFRMMPFPTIFFEFIVIMYSNTGHLLDPTSNAGTSMSIRLSFSRCSFFLSAL